jgi:hypothetical protein
MGKLNLSATIHPTDVNYILVQAETETGEAVGNVKPDDCYVRVWASATYPPGGYFVNPVPVANVRDLGFPQNFPDNVFWELQLGEVPSYDDQGKEYETTPVAFYSPLVYLVAIEHEGNRGQTFACACCPPGGEADSWAR